jgi:hypothetical protein
MQHEYVINNGMLLNPNPLIFASTYLAVKKPDADFIHSPKAG